MFDAAPYILILFEQFSGAGDVPNDVWRKRHRWDDVIFNSPLSFHVDNDMALSDGRSLALNPFKIKNGILSIAPKPIPDAALPDVKQFLKERDRYSAKKIDAVTHYTGLISLHDSWAETYGYFEIRARVPGHAGHWPAFWLATGTKGWPPEIDVFEIDMRGRNAPPIPDFKATVHFDAIDPDGQPIDTPLVNNPHHKAADGAQPQQPVRRGTDDKPRWTLGATIDTGYDLSADFYVYGLEWTPDHIIWYFGNSPDTLKEVYRTPTPPDLHSPLYVIANTEVGGLLAGDTAKGIVNDQLDIDYIKVYARTPENRLDAAGDINGTNGSDLLIGSLGDDSFRGGTGFDVIQTKGGKDAIYLAREDGNLVIEGFDKNDVLWLAGFHHAPKALWSNALQIGADLWLRDPGKPFEPRTIILRNTSRSKLSSDQLRVWAGR